VRDGSGTYDGDYDEIRVLTRVSSDDWIWAEYQNMASNETAFIAYGPAMDNEGLAWQDFTNRIAIAIESDYIDENLTDWTLVFDHSFAEVLTSEDGPLDAGSVRSARADGGDIRFSSDEAGAIRLAVDIRSWSLNANTGDATCEVAVKVPTVSSNVDTTIYMWWGNADAVQPAADEAYGQYAAYDAYYKYVTADGGKANRASASYGGTASGGVVPADNGKVGEGTGFDGNGTQDYYSLGEPGWDDFMSAVDSFSVEALVKPDNLASDLPQFVFSKVQGSTAYRGVSIYVNAAADTLYFGLNETHTPSAVSCTCESSLTLSDNTWHHVAGTYNGTANANGMNVFVNGTRDLSPIRINNGTLSTVEHDDAALIGARNRGAPSGQREFDGIIDEVRVSSTVRSGAWLKADYHNQFNTSGFIDFSGVSIVDPEDSPPSVQTETPTNISMKARGRLQDTFTTDPDDSAPSVTANSPALLEWSLADLDGEITGGFPHPDTYICVNPTASGPIDNGTNGWWKAVALGPQSGAFTNMVTGLDAEQTYVFRVYVINRVDDAWSDPIAFDTAAIPMTLTLDSHRYVNSGSAVLTFVETALTLPKNGSGVFDFSGMPAGGQQQGRSRSATTEIS